MARQSELAGDPERGSTRLMRAIGIVDSGEGTYFPEDTKTRSLSAYPPLEALYPTYPPTYPLRASAGTPLTKGRDSYGPWPVEASTH